MIPSVKKEEAIRIYVEAQVLFFASKTDMKEGFDYRKRVFDEMDSFRESWCRAVERSDHDDRI